MEILVWSVHVLLAVVLIVLVLLQHGKGADMGAAFGSGSSGSLFGASGSVTFLSRATSLIAAMFFTTSMSLTYLSMNQTKDSSVMSTMGEFEETDGVSANLEKKITLEHDLDVPEVGDSSKADQIPE